MSSTPVPRRSLDALFRHMLKPEPALAEKLRQAGYDPDHPQATYSTETYKACLELAREHLFPGLMPDEGWRRLGRLWVEGFAQTAVGAVLAAAARVIGPERVLARLPSYMRAGREDMTMDVDALGPRVWRLVVTDPLEPRPQLTAGVVDFIMGLTGVRSTTVTVESEAPGRYELCVRWTV